MEKEFIPYEQALALKELGFDEACMFTHTDNLIQYCPHHLSNTNLKPFKENPISAPLYQQAFRWFREKYDIHGEPFYKGGLTKQTSWYDYKIYSTIDWVDNNSKQQWKTSEEAELECLKKLIEIVKNEET